MPQGYSRPSNQILADKEGSVVHEYEIGANATAAQMVPGRAVIYDTVNYAVKEAGAKADNVLGVLDVAPGKGLTDAYARGDQARVIERGKVMVTLVSGGAAVAPGTPLVTAANGKFKIQETGVIGAQGAPVAYALEIMNPAGSDLWCLVFLTGQREAQTA
jgi:hypothetical protein